MKELFIVYNKNTGFIDGGLGKIDRDEDAKNFDGSTMTERIAEILKKDSGKSVVYLPNQKLPDPETQKIKEGKIVSKDDSEVLPEKHAESREQKIREGFTDPTGQKIRVNDKIIGRLMFAKKVLEIDSTKQFNWKFKDGWKVVDAKNIDSIILEINDHIEKQFNENKLLDEKL